MNGHMNITGKTVASVALLLLTPLVLQADLYVRGGLFYNDTDSISIEGLSEDYQSGIDNSTGANLAVGMKLSVLRLEGEVTYLDTDIANTNFAEVVTSGNYERMSFFGNVLVEFPMVPLIKPYLGAGIGWSDVQVDFNNDAGNSSLEDSFDISANDTNFSYQVLAGIRFSLLGTVSVYGGYRYLKVDGLSASESGYTVNTDDGNHLFELGVGIGF